jgi:CubicO group peptidase (beta-lactamase class C family)
MKRILSFLMLLSASIGFSQTIDNPQPAKTRSAKQLAKKFLKQHAIPGMSISVSKHGNLIWSRGFGHSSFNPKTKVKPQKTQFRIASISKSITALALAKMVDDHLIDLNQSIYSYLPNYPKQQYDFTVRQLGGHLAGIRHYKDNEFVLNKKMSITEGLELFKNDPLIFEPGTAFLYNSFGYVLLSKVMETVSDVPFSDFIRDSIFNPLQMKNTCLDISDGIIPNRTQFYSAYSGKKPTIAPPVANEFKVAGGGFLSTSEDIVTFGNEIVFPHLVSKEALSNLIASQQLNNGQLTGYGIGFSVETTNNGTPKYYHTGGGVGASTILLVYPKEEVVISILTNKTSVEVKDLANELEGVFLN